MRSFLLSALALFSLFGGAFVEGYSLAAYKTYNEVTSWDKQNITFTVGVTYDPTITPSFAVLPGADCNVSAPVKNVTTPKITSSVSVGPTIVNRAFKFEVTNASDAPSLINSDGVPSFCVRYYYEGIVGINSTDVVTISEIFTSYNFTKVVNDGIANFTYNASIVDVNTTEFEGEDITTIGLAAGPASNTPIIPASYKMGEPFYFCVKADTANYKVTTFKNVTCYNDGATRQLAIANATNTTFDQLTEAAAGVGLTVRFPGETKQSGNEYMQCLKNYVTAGFFSGSDDSFDCTGTAVTAPMRRRLDAFEGRSLQSLDEAETPFATTFSLDTVEYDTLTASASVVGAGLSIASGLLAMII